ncbi:MAG: pentapeptide repeat-containing protein [Rhodocyclales bacterium]|nr:pentapeptide repeat-containing protein [Rhodocyclales bacterium]
MPRTAPRLAAKKPKSVLKQPLSLNYKTFAVALAKGAGHALLGKFDDLADDGVDALAAMGIEGKTPQALLYLLLQQALQSALAALVDDCRGHLPAEIDPDALLPHLEKAVADAEVDAQFFLKPGELPLLQQVADALRAWLVAGGVAAPVATTIAQRLPSFFPYALHREWQRNGKHYEPIRQSIATPFTQAAEREAAWLTYAAQLQQRLDEGVFDEPFSLRQIYIPLHATYDEEAPKTGADGEPRRGKRRVVVRLQQELDAWLGKNSREDAVRAISGGPGSGKSSFARVFAAGVAAAGRLKVLFVPLHLINPTGDFADEIGRFVRDQGVLKHNPLDAESGDGDLLIILDGLDELASQGRSAAATARDFVRTVQQTADRRNLNELRLRVLFSGREVVMQESESEFRRARQVLTVLPYFVDAAREKSSLQAHDGEAFNDPDKLLAEDLRKAWWQNYGRLTGHAYKRLPKELDRDDLREITAQPLLNYLLALSFCRGKLDFKAGVTLNQIYHDLVDAVYERGYEQGRRHASVRDLGAEDFLLILEEIGLAAWHGDGRSTTVAEIEQHCRDGGFGNQLDAFHDGARHGITRLLAAFFFRQHGERPKGDHTFVFTHKSFGEYLTARRLVRAMQDIAEERQRRETVGRGKGWSEADALKRWAELCGPTAISPLIHQFLVAEVALHDPQEAAQWQAQFARLFSHVLRHGMPMEQLQLATFQDALFQSRNAEEALLAALNACALACRQISRIDPPSTVAFGAWFKRIQGQRSGPESVLATRCLSWLDLSNSDLYFGDYFDADFSYSNLYGIECVGANLQHAQLTNADLSKANLVNVNLAGANLRDAKLIEARLMSANLRWSNLEAADLNEASLDNANLSALVMRKATLQRADLRAADLTGSDLSESDLRGADLHGADLRGADLQGANLTGTQRKGTNLSGAKGPWIDDKKPRQ